MTPTLHPPSYARISRSRAAALRPDHEMADDAELSALKRELAAAKQRFLDLAHDAERARAAATHAENQVRVRLNAAVEILIRARSDLDGSPLGAAVDSALDALRSLSASLPPAAPPAN